MRKRRAAKKHEMVLYMNELRKGISTEPSPEWVEEWTEKANENNQRIMNKYSPSPSPEAKVVYNSGRQIPLAHDY